MQTDISTFNLDAIKEILTGNPFVIEQVQYLIRKETKGRHREKVLQLLSSHAKNMLFKSKMTHAKNLLFDPKVTVFVCHAMNMLLDPKAIPCVYSRFIVLGRT